MKRGPLRKQYDPKQQGCEKRGEAWRKQYDPKQQCCEKGGWGGGMTKTIWP